jgi:hypothetical protein
MDTSNISEIEFNWERVLKTAHEKRDALISNAPKVVIREPTSNTTTYDVVPSSNQVQVEDDGPDRNVIEIVTGIKNKELCGKDLTTDERRLVVNSLRLSGQTQDSIADLLQVSRRTIVNDYRIIRQQAALEISSKETTEIAGEVYQVAQACIRKALKAGHYKTVSTVMRDMVELLQSMGLVYRAPKTSMQASLIGNLGNRQGYHKYITTIGDDKDKVIDVLDHMFGAISEDRIS